VPATIIQADLMIGAGDDHQVRLARAGAEDLGAEAREIIVTGGGGDHLNGAARQAVA